MMKKAICLALCTVWILCLAPGWAVKSSTANVASSPTTTRKISVASLRSLRTIHTTTPNSTQQGSDVSTATPDMASAGVSKAEATISSTVSTSDTTDSATARARSRSSQTSSSNEGALQNLIMNALNQLSPELRNMVMDRFNLNDKQTKRLTDFAQMIFDSAKNSNPRSLQGLMATILDSGLLSGRNASTAQASNVTAPDLGPYTLSWPTCQLDLLAYFNGLRRSQSWALNMLDSSGKPPRSILLGNLKFMGNYLQCNDAHYRNATSFSSVDGKICRAMIKPPFDIPGNMFLGGAEARIQWDICLPSSCQDSDLNKELIRNNLIDSAYIYCTKDLEVSDDTGAIISLLVLSILGVLLLLGTLMECVVRQSTKQPKSTYIYNAYANAAAFNNKGFEMGETNLEEKADNRVPQRALLAFSIPRNTQKILGVKAAPGSIGCLHGIRVLSMGWVILGHALISTLIYENPLTVFQGINKLSFQLIINATLSVDSFFLMSGLLTAYLFMKECGKHGRVTLKHTLLYYVHRYWRLTPPMMIWIMIVANLVKYVGEGRPAWTDYASAQTCRDNWWVNLLYINNVYHYDKSCLGVTWFLAHDMQFYVVAPLALIPWAYGQKMIGFIMSAVILGVHLASTIWIELDINADILRNQPSYSDQIYFKPYTRSGPFAIGLMMGWIIWKTKCQQRMNKYVVAIGWLVSLGLILVLTLVTYDENKYTDPIRFSEGWTHEGRIVFETLRRPLWAMALAWIIYACANGYGGPINSILSWEGWLPMSRLTYCAFLVHFTTLTYESAGAETTFMFTSTTLTYHFLSVFVMSYAVAFLLAVGVEAPMLGLEKVALS